MTLAHLLWTAWSAAPCAAALASAGNDEGRIVELDVTELSEVPLALSADGKLLCFSILGDPFELSVEGGEARQLACTREYEVEVAPSASFPTKPGERVVWSGASSDGKLLAARVSRVSSLPAEAGLADGDDLVVVDGGTKQELFRSSIGPTRQATTAASPAFGAGVVYFPCDGAIRAFDVSKRELRSLPFHAKVRHHLPDPYMGGLRASRWSEQDPLPRQAVVSIAPAPDGEAIVFDLDGDLWMKEGDEPPAALTQGPEQDHSPRFALNGESIWFARDRELCRIGRDGGAVERTGLVLDHVFELDDDAAHAVTSGSFAAPGVTLHDIAAKPSRLLAKVNGRWSSSPGFLPDGAVVATLGVRNSAVPQICRLERQDGTVTPLTALERAPSAGRLSPDGRRLAIRRDGGCLLAPHGNAPVREQELVELGPVGVTAFAFSADSSRLLVARGPIVTAYAVEDGRPVATIDLTVRVKKPPSAPPLAVTHVAVVDVERGTLLEDQRVECAGGRIVRVVPEPQAGPLPAGATIDGRGRFLIPGLVDDHVHAPGPFLSSLAAYGVTRVRDVGGGWPMSWGDVERVELGLAAGPRLLLAGEIFEGFPTIWGDAFHACEDEREAFALLDDRAARGIDLVKVYPSLSEPLRAAILGHAHERGLATAGHADNLRLMVTEIDAGLDCFEHVPGALVQQDVLALMAAGGVAWCPTLDVMGGGDWKLRQEPGERETPRFVKAVPEASRQQARFGAYYAWSSTRNLAAILDERCRLVARAFRMDIPILVGTDAPNSNCFHGPGTHWEMELLVRGGLTPAEALRCATVIPARVWHLAEGRVAQGCAADLVLLAKDPLKEIRATQSIERVVLRGRPFTPEELLGSGVRGY